MIGIVVIAHGELARALVSTATMIIGEQPGLCALGLAGRESVDTLRTEAGEAIGRHRETGCLVLTDLMGGSATNVCVELVREPWVRVVTGVNLPMLIEAVQHRDKLPLVQLAARVREAALKGVFDLEEFIAARRRKPAASPPAPPAAPSSAGSPATPGGTA